MSKLRKENCELEVYINSNLYVKHKRWDTLIALDDYLRSELDNSMNEENSLQALAVTLLEDNSEYHEYAVEVAYLNVSGFMVSLKYKGHVNDDCWELLAKI